MCEKNIVHLGDYFYVLVIHIMICYGTIHIKSCQEYEGTRVGSIFFQLYFFPHYHHQRVNMIKF